MMGLGKWLRQNTLLKIASANSTHILIRIATGAVMSKIIAYYVGAAGMGIMGNLRNFVQGAQSFTVLGLENGLVKNTAQHADDPVTLKKTLATAWTLIAAATVVVAIAIFIAAPWLDRYLIATDYSFITLFRVFAVSLPFWVGFVFISSLLQGLQLYKKFIGLNIAISLCVFALSAWLTYDYNLIGALYAIILAPVLQCVLAIIVWSRVKNVPLQLRDLVKAQLDKKTATLLLRYSIMALVSALLLPLVHILVRDNLRVVVSDEAAGWWEAMTRMSGYYMLFVTSLISLYVLPQLSKDDSRAVYRRTIRSFYKTILPLVAVGMIAVYLAKDFLIWLLFNDDFSPMTSFFKWQLAGDFIKVITTVLAFRFIALNDLKRYLIAELISIATFYLSSLYLINTYGADGVVMAHVVTYMVYLLVLLVLLRRDLFSALES